jgi:hypothetical protein
VMVADRMHSMFCNSHYDKHEQIRNACKIIVRKPEGPTGKSG